MQIRGQRAWAISKMRASSNLAELKFLNGLFKYFLYKDDVDKYSIFK